MYIHGAFDRAPIGPDRARMASDRAPIGPDRARILIGASIWSSKWPSLDGRPQMVVQMAVFR